MPYFNIIHRLQKFYKIEHAPSLSEICWHDMDSLERNISIWTFKEHMIMWCLLPITFMAHLPQYRRSLLISALLSTPNKSEIVGILNVILAQPVNWPIRISQDEILRKRPRKQTWVHFLVKVATLAYFHISSMLNPKMWVAKFSFDQKVLDFHF